MTRCDEDSKDSDTLIRRHSGPHPGTSPASYNADQSFLLNRGLHVSSQGSHHVVSADEENHLDDRGRHRKRRGSSSRLSRSSLNSASRLSPTRESSVDSRTWDDEGQSALLDDHDERPISRLGDEPFSSNGHINLNGSAPSPMPNLPSLIPSTQLDNETTPLLPSVPVPAKDVADRRAYMHELKVLISYSVPIAGTHFLEYSLLVVTVVSLGHLGTVELAAASIANMTSNVVALSVTQGLCSALDTLCPQAYTSKPKDTSLYALRTGVLLLLLFIPQCIILWNAEWILIHMRQDPRVAERAGLYLKVLTFGLPGYGGFECVRRWLQAQGLMLAPVLTLILAAPLNVILNYLLVWGPEGIRLGFIGAPLATAISMNAMFITSLVYAVLFAPRDAWGGISWAICESYSIDGFYQRVHEYISDILLCDSPRSGSQYQAWSRWYSYGGFRVVVRIPVRCLFRLLRRDFFDRSWEIVGLASSFLGPSTLAAQSVLLTSASCFYQVPYSLSVAAAVRVGNLLGGQRPRTAKVTSRVTLYLATGIAGVNSIMLICLRHR